MDKISSVAGKERIPAEASHIQINFCKNPACGNYGVLPRVAVTRGPGLLQDSYVITSGHAQGVPLLHCRLCGEYPPIKSNIAIAEERDRMRADLQQAREPTCPDTSCAHHAVPVSQGTAFYQLFGITRSGSRRYRCKACQKTFSVRRSTTGQKQPHKNRTVFTLLMNKSPFRRILEVADISASSFYGKIDFLFGQCLAFAAERERRLLAGMPIRRLYLGTDRQDYVVNWTSEHDRRNVVLHAVGTADNTTGYVFGMHLNYDPSLDGEDVEVDAEALGDAEKKPPFRRYARVWLEADYRAAARRQMGRRVLKADGLKGEIAATYDEAVLREDVEAADTPNAATRLPARGMQVHAEYSLYGHCFFLKELFAGVEKLRFFLDQDSGMRAAFLSAFQPEIAARRADAFYVRIQRELTINQKRAAVAASHSAFEAARRECPDLDDSALELLLAKAQLARMSTYGQWQDKWLIHPFPNMSEPEKAICYLTDYKDYDEEHLARLYLKASLHAIDRFFMQVRRRLSILERPIATASSARRIWYGYSAYNPEVIVKLLGIFRVFYNYCLAGKDRTTPAMRLGLAQGKVTLEDIIYF